jgi:hypothetical protein
MSPQTQIPRLTRIPTAGCILIDSLTLSAIHRMSKSECKGFCTVRENTIEEDCRHPILGSFNSGLGMHGNPIDRNIWLRVGFVLTCGFPRVKGSELQPPCPLPWRAPNFSPPLLCCLGSLCRAGFPFFFFQAISASLSSGRGIREEWCGEISPSEAMRA